MPMPRCARRPRAILQDLSPALPITRSDLTKVECPGSAVVGKDRSFVKRDEFMAERSEPRRRRDLKVRSENAAPNERTDVGHWCEGATFEVRSDDEVTAPSGFAGTSQGLPRPRPLSGKAIAVPIDQFEAFLD